MSDNAIAGATQGNAPAASDPGLSVGLFVAFAVMAWLALVSVVYAISMIGFLGEGGWFLAYGSLCDTVPVVAAIGQFVPFVVAASWIGAIYFGLTKSPRFYRYVRTVSVLTIAYGAVDVFLGPFTFRVGPADVDPATLTCGRWPRDITQLPDLQVMQLDMLAMPISVFGVSLIILGLGIYVFSRVSRRVMLVYKRG